MSTTEQEKLPFDPDALREKYRAGARQAPARRRQRPVPGGGRATSPTTSRIRTSSPFAREPLTDEVDVVVIGGGFGGLLAGARLREAGVDGHPHHREGRRLRRHLVLEPLPRRDVRRRVLHLPAAARGDRLRPDGEVLARARDPRPQPGHRPALRPLRNACFQTEVTELRWDDDERALDRLDQPRRPHARRASCAWRTARCTGRSCPASPASRRSRATPSTPAAGTTTTPAATPTANLTGLRDKRVGIIGTGATAVQCVPHLGEAAEQLYVFQRTPSSIDVRDNRPTDPEWAAEPGARLAAAAHGQLQHPGVRRLPGRGPGQRRLDRHHPQAADHGAQRRAPATSAPRAWRPRWSWPTSRRWSRSAPASTPSCRTRRRPRR